MKNAYKILKMMTIKENKLLQKLNSLVKNHVMIV